TEDVVDLGPVRVGGELLDVVRVVGLLVEGQRRGVDAGRGEERDRHVLGTEDAGQRYGLAVRVARGSPVLRTGRIVVRRGRALRLEQAEEHADLVRTDESDVVHFRQ